MGSLKDLTEAREATATTITTTTGEKRPGILRKDFIISEYMILEGVAAGADTVLLIVAILPSKLLERLIGYCHSLGVEPLVEVHTTEELEVALHVGARVIGVNNRNLHTFSLDLNTTDKVASFLQSKKIRFEKGGDDYALCALSGMSNADDVQRYRSVGVGMVLIGESLMRASDPLLAIQSLCLDPKDYQSISLGVGGGAYISGTKIVKICGITNTQDALFACQQGANLIGVIFASKSKRKVSTQQAREIVNTVRKFGERSDRITFPSSNTSPINGLRQKSNQLYQTASKTPLVVGVFQNQSKEFINDVIQETGLDLIQLHGHEGMEAANSTHYNGVSAIRVVDIPAKNENTCLEDEILSCITSDPFAILLDTTVKHGVEGGGTGKTFDWNIVEKIQNKGLPVIIAGGLTPENVGEAVGGVRPFGIDVSSGVEQKVGKKDLGKVRLFVKGVRDAALEASKGI